MEISRETENHQNLKLISLVLTGISSLRSEDFVKVLSHI